MVVKNVVRLVYQRVNEQISIPKIMGVSRSGMAYMHDMILFVA